MKRIFIFIILLLVPLNSLADEISGNAYFFWGQNSLRDTDWHDAETMRSLGLLTDFKYEDWPVNISLDIFGSGASDSGENYKIKGYIYEYAVGIRKHWDKGGILRPFVGGGVVVIQAGREEDSHFRGKIKDSDIQYSFWSNGGISLYLNDRFNIGLVACFSYAEAKLSGAIVDVGGSHYGLSAGYRW